MRSLDVRDLGGESAKVWKELPEEGETVVTNNGRPIAILSSVDEGSVEEALSAFRQARAVSAVATLQGRSVEKGTDSLSLADVDGEIRAARKARRSSRKSSRESR